MFPILRTLGRENQRPDRLKSIPWALIDPHEKQALTNHSQTLNRLAQRGGLSPQEALSVLHDECWDMFSQLKSDEADTQLRALVDEFERNRDTEKVT